MTDATYQTLVYTEQGGGTLHVKSGGVINIETGATFTVDGTQPSAITAGLTTITIADAAGTPDYAIQAVTNTNAWGLASQQEMISLLYVIKNLQNQVYDLQARLEALGMVVAN